MTFPVCCYYFQLIVRRLPVAGGLLFTIWFLTTCSWHFRYRGSVNEAGEAKCTWSTWFYVPFCSSNLVEITYYNELYIGLYKESGWMPAFIYPLYGESLGIPGQPYYPISLCTDPYWHGYKVTWTRRE